MAAAPHVIGAAPVDELVARGGREQDIARRRAVQGRPDAAEGVGVLVADEAVILERRLQRGRVALEVPAAAAVVLELVPRGEAQLAAA